MHRKRIIPKSRSCTFSTKKQDLRNKMQVTNLTESTGKAALTKTSSRRQFVLALSSGIVSLGLLEGATALAAGVAQPTSPIAKNAQISIDQLTVACNTLAGTKIDNPPLVKQYLTVLNEILSPAQRSSLIALARLPAPQQVSASRSKSVRTAAEMALQLWMTAMTTDEKVLGYLDAPVWSVLNFTKPPGVCGGAFGYWAEKPA